MSVVYGDRGLSKMEFWKQFCRLEADIMSYLLRDFGIKNRTREPEFYAKIYNFSKDDTEVFTRLCQQYGINKVIDEYPHWIIEYLRNQIMTILAEIKHNIRFANEVYPYHESEYYARRNYQDDAIRGCGALYDVFTLCKNVLPIKVDTYDDFVKRIQYEASLLIAWRKSDNVILKRILDRKRKSINNALGTVMQIMEPDIVISILNKVEDVAAFLRGTIKT